MSLSPALAARLRLPLIAAPMLRVSGPDLVAAACASGVIGAFPTVNARGSAELDAWLTRIHARLAEVPGPVAPVCPNIIMRRQTTLADDLAVLLHHRVEMVIASVGSPEAVIQPLHDIGCQVFADVASIRHAEKALAVGADGLVLLTAGAGGQTGWANPFAFVRAVRAMFDGPIVLSGGMSDGAALWAARALGCDLAMMGTRFIATPESMAGQPHKAMLVDSRLDDVMLTQAFTGLDANMLRPSIVAAGLDPRGLEGKVSPERARELFSAHGQEATGPKRWVDIWSAGHSVSGVTGVQPVAELVEQLAHEYQAARAQAHALA
ncbi:2-nitropropane dioxygenase [Comamonas serinivorans]|uniref:2-nitropropane dioxygenase n=1 Tax=Comamonas serinivorans TaxID=1082851 RepID=A0A1Y0EPQ4_9BURK|nr:nitronate monooxygenase [Comamonas serinivorans]ARU05556.1 2-nitropropane dioxygenase [Comamonas serinivorans]